MRVNAEKDTTIAARIVQKWRIPTNPVSTLRDTAGRPDFLIFASYADKVTHQIAHHIRNDQPFAALVPVDLLHEVDRDKHGKIDDTPFGGGAGMVMAIQPIVDAIADLKSQRDYDKVIYLTPDGERLTQPRVNQLSLCGNLILLCGHYKGVDQRIREQVINLELSIGDYVLSGGELAAAVLADALALVRVEVAKGG